MIALYPADLLDKFRALTGMDEQALAAWLHDREVMYEAQTSRQDWLDDAGSAYSEIYSNVTLDLALITKGHMKP